MPCAVNIKIFLVVLISLLIFIQGIFLLPALDRDESRFAASTKNMIESNDFIDIKLEDVPRYKKPIGIYWAQAVSTILLGKDPYNEIWTYRIEQGCWEVYRDTQWNYLCD